MTQTVSDSEECCLCLTDDTIIMPKLIREVCIQRCVAECLGLLQVDKKSCNFSQTSGGVLGEKCAENEFFNAAPEKKVLCSYSVTSLATLPFVDTPIIKVCDFVEYSDLLRFHAENYTIYLADDEIESLRPTMQYARSIGIKNLLHLGGWGSALLFSKIAANESIRADFGAQIKELMVKYNWDGVYIKWLYPNCPENTDCGMYKLDDRLGVTNMLKDLNQILKPINKYILYFASINSIFLTFSAGDVYSPTVNYVDYYVLDAHGQSGHWSISIDLPSNLKKLKDNIEYFKKKISNSKAVLRKILIVLNVGSVTFELKTPNVHKLGSGFHQKSNLPKYSSFADVCVAITKLNFTTVRSKTTQNYAYRDEVWYAYDDYDSLAEKVKFINSIEGAGIGLHFTDMDDVKNRCGCGKMPFLRMVGELLKGGECVLDRCL